MSINDFSQLTTDFIYIYWHISMLRKKSIR